MRIDGCDDVRHRGAFGDGDGDVVDLQDAALGDGRTDLAVTRHRASTHASITLRVATLAEAQRLDERVGAADADLHVNGIGARGDDEIVVADDSDAVGRIDRVVGMVVERVARQKRHEDQPVRALVDEIQAMVKELAEDGHHAAVGQRVDVAGQRREAATGCCRRVVLNGERCLLVGQSDRIQSFFALIGHKIADDPRRGIVKVHITDSVAYRLGGKG